MGTDQILVVLAAAVGAGIFNLLIAGLNNWGNRKGQTTSEAAAFRKDIQDELHVVRESLEKTQLEVSNWRDRVFTLREENLTLRAENIDLKKQLSELQGIVAMIKRERSSLIQAPP